MLTTKPVEHSGHTEDLIHSYTIQFTPTPTHANPRTKRRHRADHKARGSNHLVLPRQPHPPPGHLWAIKYGSPQTLQRGRGRHAHAYIHVTYRPFARINWRVHVPRGTRYTGSWTLAGFKVVGCRTAVCACAYYSQPSCSGGGTTTGDVGRALTDTRLPGICCASTPRCWPCPPPLSARTPYFHVQSTTWLIALCPEDPLLVPSPGLLSRDRLAPYALDASCHPAPPPAPCHVSACPTYPTCHVPYARATCHVPHVRP